jgi:hypothetical protein
MIVWNSNMVGVSPQWVRSVRTDAVSIPPIGHVIACLIAKIRHLGMIEGLGVASGGMLQITMQTKVIIQGL